MLRVAVAPVEIGVLAHLDAPPPWFGASERVRWPTLAPAARAAFVESRALLRRLLHASTGVDAACWDVSAEAGTEPLVRLAGSSAAPPRASLSHRRGWVAAAASNGAVGIDLELAQTACSDPLERASLMLSPAELEDWTTLAPDLRELALLTRWAVKEAWFKACPTQSSAWDFRRVVACACAPERANVRAWAAPPLHVAVSCSDAQALAVVHCEGLLADEAHSSFWQVGLAVS